MDLSGLSGLSVHPELLPNVLDRLARQQPSKTWASVSKCGSTSGAYAFEDVSYKVFANAVNRLAWFVGEKLGAPTRGTFPTVAYLGGQDVRYLIVFIALVKVGFKFVPLRASNPLSNQLHSIDTTDCQFLLHAKDVDANEIGKQRASLRTVVLPDLADVLDDGEVQNYPYDRSIEGLNDPAIVVHTSGSTGLPKPVTYPQGYIVFNGLAYDIPDLNGQPVCNKLLRTAQRMHIGFPISQAAGIFHATYMSLFNGITIVMCAADPLFSSTLESVIRYGDIDAALVSPVTLVQIASSRVALERLSKLKYVCYAGGPVPKASGEILSQHTHLLTKYGSTEHSTPISHATAPPDWCYTHLNPTYTCIHWRPLSHEHNNNNSSSNSSNNANSNSNSSTPISANGSPSLTPPAGAGAGATTAPIPKPLYTPIVVRSENLAIRYFQPVFWAYPELAEWPMRDLFSRHPTMQDHWRYEGRMDDVLVLADGYSVHTGHCEREILGRDGRVERAVLVGDGRRSVGVVVEMKEGWEEMRMRRKEKVGRKEENGGGDGDDDDDDDDVVMEEIQVEEDGSDKGEEEEKDAVEVVWELVQKWNRRCSKLARIPKKNIILVQRGRELPRDLKGDVLRQEVEELYKEEIERIYSEEDWGEGGETMEEE